MLADLSGGLNDSGSLSPEVQKPATFRHELVEFIAKQLPIWRDRPERKVELAEAVLTSQLCAHLNGIARHSPGWDILQFRVEEVDELRPDRKIDLVPAPCGATICIDGRRHSEFDPILPVECKRLPTPLGAKRDEREYVINRHNSTGGIDRFKRGFHASSHEFGAMIAYIQEETTAVWDERVGSWIKELVDSAEPGWSSNDLLLLEQELNDDGVTTFRSVHERKHLKEIKLRHLWIEMN